MEPLQPPWDLRDLKWHWGSCYRFTGHGQRWTATRKDNGRVLTAASADELVGLVREDYRQCPIDRPDLARLARKFGP